MERQLASVQPPATVTAPPSQPPLVLRLTHPEASSSRRSHVIQWSADTIDNEFMGKKKSKCCCIYEKPRNFDDPSSSSSSESSSDDEGSGPRPKKCTEHCRGHTRHCFTKKIAKNQHEQQIDLQPPAEDVTPQDPRDSSDFDANK